MLNLRVAHIFRYLVSLLAMSGILWASTDVARSQQIPTLGISEIKLGALYHDVPGLWSGLSVERPAADANLELLFSPLARAFGGTLRPALGATLNFNGDTSKAYADLRWQHDTPSGIFFALGMGLAVHNGNTDPTDTRKALGFPVLFHPSAEIGYTPDGINSISVFADHMSNGYSQRFNEGMDTIGIRFGHRFLSLSADEPPPTPSKDFSGAYIGAFAGYQRESSSWYTPTISSIQNTMAGWGGYAGYNWQSGKGIFGFEFDGSPFKRDFAVNCDQPSIVCQTSIAATYSVRARFGWVVDNVMFYGSGGVAMAQWDSKVTSSTTGQQFDRVSGLNYGVAIAAGVEFKPNDHVGIRTELAHYGLPGWDQNLPTVGVTANQYESYVARVGLTWYLH